MRKVISLVLVLAVCLSLCACGETKSQEELLAESIAKEQAEALSIEEKLIGCWEYIAGWNEAGDEMEFSENGTCLINDEEHKWETISKVKPGTSNAKDYVNIYADDVLAYEAYVNIWDDGTISMVIHEANEESEVYIPDGTYVKADHEH